MFSQIVLLRYNIITFLKKEDKTLLIFFKKDITLKNRRHNSDKRN